MSGTEPLPAPHSGRLIAGRFPAPPAAPPSLTALLAEVIQRGRTPASQRGFRADLRRYLSWLLATPLTISRDPLGATTADPDALRAALTATTEGTIAAYLATMRADRLAPTTINRHLTTLRILYARLHRYGLLTIDPLADIHSLRVGNASTRPWLTRDQVRQLTATCAGATLDDLRDRALLCLTIGTGIRAAELIGLTIPDLGTISGHPVAWVNGKGGARERVKIPASAHAALTRWLAATGRTAGPLFPALSQRQHGLVVTNRPLTPKSLGTLLRRRLTQAGLPTTITPHSLRHTFVTLAHEAGAPLPLIQAAARHRHVETTMRYLHQADALAHNAVDYLNL